jgi:hypothetical protein
MRNAYGMLLSVCRVDNDPHDAMQPVQPQGSCAGCLDGAPEFCGSGKHGRLLPCLPVLPVPAVLTVLCACAWQRRIALLATRQWCRTAGSAARATSQSSTTRTTRPTGRSTHRCSWRSSQLRTHTLISAPRGAIVLSDVFAAAAADRPFIRVARSSPSALLALLPAAGTITTRCWRTTCLRSLSWCRRRTSGVSVWGHRGTQQLQVHLSATSAARSTAPAVVLTAAGPSALGLWARAAASSTRWASRRWSSRLWSGVWVSLLAAAPPAVAAAAAAAAPSNDPDDDDDNTRDRSCAGVNYNDI